MKRLLVFLLMISTSAFGQSAAQLQAELGKKQARLWGATLINTTSATMLDPESNLGRLNHTITGMFRYKLPWFNLRLLGSGSKDLTGARQDRFTTAFIEAGSVVGALSNDTVTTIFQGRFNPAVNDERRFNESHRGAFSAGLLYIVKLPHPKWQLIGVTRATKNIHEFEINRSFGQNTSVQATTYAGLSYFPEAGWEVNFNATLLQGWDYNGESQESNLFLGQSVTYNYSRNVIMSLGHELGGRTFGYDQNNLEVTLFDEDKSSFFLSLTLNY